MSHYSHSFSSSRGITLYIVVMSLVGIFGLMAITLDLNFFSAAKTQAQGYARLASLAAIEQYFSNMKCGPNQNDLCSVAQRLDASLARSQQISIDNKVFMLTDRGLSNNARMVLTGNAQANPDLNGIVEPGRWVTTANPNENCVNGESKPCFVPFTQLGDIKNYLNDPPNSPKLGITAFRVRGEFYPRLYANGFAQMLGFQVFPVKVYAVATLVARHGCFLVDITNSMITSTHGTKPTVNFGLQSYPGGIFPNTCSSYYQGNVVCPGPNCACPGGDYVPRQHVARNWLQTNQPTRGASVNPKIHFSDDYVSKRIIDDNDFSADFAQYHPLASDFPVQGWDMFPEVDMYPPYNANTPNANSGPEPFATVLRSLGYAIDRFEERQVPGDRLCLVFYDDHLEWPRMVKLTGKFDYLKKMVEFKAGPTDSLAEVLGNQVSIQPDDIGGRLRTYRHHLFANAERLSDTFMALRFGFDELTRGQAGQAPSADFLALVGDYAPICLQCGLLQGQAQQDCLTLRCGNQFSFYRDSHKQIMTLLQNAAVPNHVAVHVLHVGGHAGPHTVLKKNPNTGQCYSDAELRTTPNGRYTLGGDANGNWFNNVNPNSEQWNINPGVWHSNFYNKSDSAPFYQIAADAYDIARLTRGLYFPVRPSQDQNGMCQPEDCSAMPVNTVQRRTLDSQCRPQSQQLSDFVDQLLGANPYQVVAVE